MACPRILLICGNMGWAIMGGGGGNIGWGVKKRFWVVEGCKQSHNRNLKGSTFLISQEKRGLSSRKFDFRCEERSLISHFW